ncbi:MAG: helix-turn-helix transcriptional regulator [Rhodospirillales bacterium]|nr:helix-turn-helix transcriptional regulator [Alphaproteobacteria bacterium]MCB1840244.1 helix-turn-helix transcriptional regulator [Alphaproteobacteria bacterium]MCB9977680.1 helix-turn-helix transcriptional regulator [Rhodospirillales bacterium]
MVKRNEHCLNSECPIACSLDLIGDHWTLLIVRSLMFEHRHEYKDLLAIPERISSNILSDRLKKLEEEGLIRSVGHPESKRRKLYYLTDKGKDLIFVLLDIARWGVRHLGRADSIPPEKQAVLGSPPEQVAKFIFEDLKAWEKKFVR